MSPLIKFIRENCCQEGIITLSSGKESNFYIDCKKLLLTKLGSKK